MTSHLPTGFVALVGAGPGDPGLITVRGAALLEQAEVVVYDYLANPKLLSYCPQAESIYVGKKAAQHSMSQAEINELLIKYARAGKRVVRLKGGDPFVFGRGGEECEALANAKIPFEVVPGITAALAAPAYAGIPVTHRDFNSSFTFITGHEKEEEYRDLDSRGRKPAEGSSDLDWSSIAKLPCIAFYMGAKSLPRICERLIAHGMPADTPAATIQWGTTPRQRTVVATISDLPERVKDAGIGAPAITIIGRVVKLRETMNWFETRPLFGQTIVVTRTRQQASDLSSKLEQLGANIIEAPTIELQSSTDPVAIERALNDASQFDWIVFTSANGVTYTRAALDQLHLDARAFGLARIAAIGDATAAAIRREMCLKVDLCPASFVAEALADELESRGYVAGKKFLMLRADIARPVLRERLERGGAAEVRDVPIYETKPAQSLPAELIDALEKRQVKWITFTSSSTVENLVRLLGADYLDRLKGIHLASIGPITSETMTRLKLTPTTQADAFNVDGLVNAILSRASSPSPSGRGPG